MNSAVGALGQFVQPELGVSIPQGGGAVVKGSDGTAVFITATGSVRPLPFKVNSINWGITVPSGGAVVIKDVSGQVYLVTAAGACGKLAVP